MELHLYSADEEMRVISSEWLMKRIQPQGSLFGADRQQVLDRIESHRRRLERKPMAESLQQKHKIHYTNTLEIYMHIQFEM
jgi:hypothetical protein